MSEESMRCEDVSASAHCFEDEQPKSSGEQRRAAVSDRELVRAEQCEHNTEHNTTLVMS